jgi:hypothetical protein
MTSSIDPRPPAHSADGSRDRQSVGELLADVSQDITTLLRQEVELAKAEIKQSATRAGKGAGMFAGAGLGAHMVLLFVSIAAWWAIGDKTGHGWSALIVAGIWLVIAAVLALLGRTEFKAVRGIPQTADTVKKIPDAVKGNEASP